MKMNNEILKTVKSIKKLPNGKRVINLYVAKNHTFIHSSGCVVHNCNSQSALRGLIEEFSKNCRFIFTCNFKNRIIEPLRNSRLTNVDFHSPDFRTPEILKRMLGRLSTILESEGIPFEKPVVAELLMQNAPDFRKTISEIQRYAIQHDAIDSGILSSSDIDIDIKNLISAFKNKAFKQMRQWVVNHQDVDSSRVFRKLYDSAGSIIVPQSIPQLILILAEYGYRDAMVVDKEINMVACFVEIMGKVEFN